MKHINILIKTKSSNTGDHVLAETATQSGKWICYLNAVAAYRPVASSAKTKTKSAKQNRKDPNPSKTMDLDRQISP